MPRRSRLSIPGVPWHIIQRGNNRSDCFYAEEDYRRYLDTLKEQADKYECLVHAYVLMTNHVHLLITPKYVDSASLMMKHLGQRYVQYINRTYKRSGTLWEGRFRSCITQNESYVLACYRYIELNPVRANMAGHPNQYAWSSYKVNAEDKESKLITPNEEYMRLGLTKYLRKEAYRGLFTCHMDTEVIDDIRASTNGNYVLGDDKFREEISMMLKRRVVRGKAGRPVKKY